MREQETAMSTVASRVSAQNPCKGLSDGREKSRIDSIMTYELSGAVSLRARSRSSWISLAIAYFSSSIPLPVTAEISYNFNFLFLQ